MRCARVMNLVMRDGMEAASYVRSVSSCYLPLGALASTSASREAGRHCVLWLSRVLLPATCYLLPPRKWDWFDLAAKGLLGRSWLDHIMLLTGPDGYLMKTRYTGTYSLLAPCDQST